MAIRKEVKNFSEFGRLPSEADNSEEGDAAFQELADALHAITPPVSDDEAALLLKSFGEDNCFGLAWTLVHLIESAPSPAVASEPSDDENPWLKSLWVRYQNTLKDWEGPTFCHGFALVLRKTGGPGYGCNDDAGG